MNTAVFGMNQWIVMLSFLLLMLPVSAAAGDYLLGPGDILSITVIGHEELNLKSLEEITIRSDGKFAMPLAGEIRAEGLSPEELSRKITERLSFYLEEPSVTVNVMRFRTMRVYVLGEVNRPGLYELDKSRNLVDAIGLAQGWTKDAAKKKVFIIHRDRQRESQRINLLDLLNKGDISKNCTLNEGDIVYLSENHRINIASDVLPFINSAYDVRHWNSN